ncbi:MAG TPA: SCO family protein [Candidatus Polarisedimenticolaceae bacterium]|nr:SCO family protein [Candidatus Polarisedimenticolaceae bacterium]
MSRLAPYLVLALLGGPAAAQTAAPAPPRELEGVGIDPRTDAQLPLELRFRDETGRAVALGELFHADRPVVLILAYYRCPMLCGLVLGGTVDAVKQLAWTPGREFELVTVSIDPAETPELAAAKKRSLLEALGRPDAGAGWHFLTGEAAAIERLAEAAGFRYRYLLASGEFAHPATLILATPAGRISRYLYGVRYEPATLRLSLVEAAAGKIGSPLDQFLLYCYRYDEHAGRYTPLAWKLMRLSAGLTAAGLAAGLGLAFRRERRRRKAAA